MAKLLYISNISNGVSSFSKASVLAAKEIGFEFYLAANFNGATKEKLSQDEKEYGVHLCHIDLVRNPYSIQNVKAYKQLVELINKEKIDFIHCNTPVGGLLGRLAGNKCNVKGIIYQAHGFHFYKGAPLKNWLIYYPIERWMSNYTDALITINLEDYEIAKSFNLRNKGNVYYVPGVGIDLNKFNVKFNNKELIKNNYHFNDNHFILISVGRLDENKNNKTLIKAISLINDKNVQLIICGDGEKKQELITYSDELGIKDKVHFLGNCENMIEMYAIADVFVMASYREGLSRSIMEAMASGLPCIVSNIRGNRDLIKNEINGFLVSANDARDFSEKIMFLKNKNNVRNSIRISNIEDVKKFSLDEVKKIMLEIYKETII